MFPGTCLSCGSYLTEGDGKLVCEKELAKEQWLGEFSPRCCYCDQLLPITGKEGMCYDCFYRIERGEKYLRRSQALFFYKGVMRELYAAFKYEGRRHAFLDLQKKMWEIEPYWRRTVSEADLVIFVPSHWYHEWRRGFSPVEMCWREFFPSLEKGMLRRRFSLVSQKTRSREERLRAIRGQFEVVKRDLIESKRVLVLDDVYTTGSTLEEIARILREAGAASVEALVLFRD